MWYGEMKGANAKLKKQEEKLPGPIMTILTIILLSKTYMQKKQNGNEIIKCLIQKTNTSIKLEY